MITSLPITCLPGRVAVLVAEQTPNSAIVLPDAVRQRAIQMERPPYELQKGEVVAVGAPRGRVPMPKIGEQVWVLPKPGLTIQSGDLDLPGLGRQIPDGFSLRLYGVGDRWYDQILGSAMEAA